MAKTDRVLRLLEAASEPPERDRPRARAGAPDRRAHGAHGTSPRSETSGIPVEGERGRGGSYRIKPGYRVPPLMFTPKEAAAVALGLMAAKRLGIETDAALAKVRRVLPDRLKLGVESLEQTLGFTERVEAEPPDAETLLTLADAARRTAGCASRYTDSQGATTMREITPVGRGRPSRALVRRRRSTTRARRRGRSGSTGPRTSSRRAGRPTRPTASTPPTSSAARWPASPGSTASRSSCTPTRPARSQHFPPTLANLEPTAHGTVLRMRADSLDWAAGLLAGANCDFTIRHPPELRDSVKQLAKRLNAA